MMGPAATLRFLALLALGSLSPVQASQTLEVDQTAPLCADITAGMVSNEVLRAALNRHDPEAWSAWLTRVAERGETNSILLDARLAMDRMPRELREEMIRLTARLRSEAPKNIEENHYDPHSSLPPRRALDAILSSFLDPKTSIERAIANGRTPQEAYQAYLDRVQKYLGRTRRERYDVTGILGVARGIQAVLKRNRDSRRWTQDPYVILAGSFPNGRARITESDVDVVLAPRALEDLTRSFNRAITRAMPDGAKLPLEHRGEIADPVEHEHFFATINPIVIYVDADKIEVRVYPLGTTRYYNRGPRVEPLRLTF